jgi:hypothetical protein
LISHKFQPPLRKFTAIKVYAIRGRIGSLSIGREDVLDKEILLPLSLLKFLPFTFSTPLSPSRARLLSPPCSDKFGLHPERDAANLLSYSVSPKAVRFFSAQFNPSERMLFFRL